MAIDPARFAGGATLAATIDDVIEDLRAEGDVLFPGEPEYLEQRTRTDNGIPIDAEALADMNAWSEKLGVAPLTR
jgi:ureidoglycolate dehydrogenase (NAD+)